MQFQCRTSMYVLKLMHQYGSFERCYTQATFRLELNVRYQEMSLIQGVLVRNSSWSLTTSSTTPSQSYLFWRFTANPSKSWNNNVKLGILKRVHLPKLSTFRKIGNVGNFIYEELEMINCHFFNQTFRSYLFWRFETFPLILLQT